MIGTTILTKFMIKGIVGTPMIMVMIDTPTIVMTDILMIINVGIIVVTIVTTTNSSTVQRVKTNIKKAQRDILTGAKIVKIIHIFSQVGGPLKITIIIITSSKKQVITPTTAGITTGQTWTTNI